MVSNKATLGTQAATASRGQAHRASSSHRHLDRPQTPRTGRRGLSLGPGVAGIERPGPASQGVQCRRGLGWGLCCGPETGGGGTEGQAAFQVETTLAGRTSGRKGRMCASRAAGAPALASAKGKRCSHLAGHGLKQQSQKGASQLAGLCPPARAAPPVLHPLRLPGNGLQRQWPKT